MTHDRGNCRSIAILKDEAAFHLVVFHLAAFDEELFEGRLVTASHASFTLQATALDTYRHLAGEAFRDSDGIQFLVSLVEPQLEHDFSWSLAFY